MLDASFNSLSRDHKKDKLITLSISIPPFNSLSRDHTYSVLSAPSGRCEDFQLPLSGSPIYQCLICGRYICLSTPSLGITGPGGEEEMTSRPELSTPSLGITRPDEQELHHRLPRYFQLPLSGSLERRSCDSGCRHL